MRKNVWNFLRKTVLKFFWIKSTNFWSISVQSFLIHPLHPQRLFYLSNHAKNLQFLFFSSLSRLLRQNFPLETLQVLFFRCEVENWDAKISSAFVLPRREFLRLIYESIWIIRKTFRFGGGAKKFVWERKKLNCSY